MTIGAGIYVLIGAAAARAGMHAPIAFLLAAIIMGRPNSDLLAAATVGSNNNHDQGWVLDMVGLKARAVRSSARARLTKL